MNQNNSGRINHVLIVPTVLFSILVLLALLFFVYRLETATRQIRDLKQTNLTLNNALKTEREQTEKLDRQLAEAEQLLVDMPDYGLKSYMSSDDYYGFPGGPDAIVRDLADHTELIPLKAVLGGRMHFTRAVVLSNRLVYAEFEDGHIVGEALLEYFQVGEGNLAWKVVYYEDE